MALSFPRDMITGRRWRRARFWLQRRQEVSRTAGGVPIVADLGPAVWRADFETIPLLSAEADAVLADFESLGGALRSFLAYPVEHKYPASLPSETVLSGLTVRAISTDRQRIGIDGLPGGFTLTAGDYLSIPPSGGGYEFYAFAEGGDADGSGDSPMLTLTQPVRPRVSVGDVADLVRPTIEMKLEPGTLSRNLISYPLYSVSFQAWQVIR